MNKKEAIVEKLKGTKIKRCPRCGEYVKGKPVLGLKMIAYDCPICQNEYYWWNDNGLWRYNDGDVL